MTQFSRMQKYHGKAPEESIESSEELLVDDTLNSGEEVILPTTKSKLEKYNTFLNKVIIITSLLLVGIFIAMFFF